MIIKIRNGIIKKKTHGRYVKYVLASYLQSGHELLVARERRVGDPWDKEQGMETLALLQILVSCLPTQDVEGIVHPKIVYL